MTRRRPLNDLERQSLFNASRLNMMANAAMDGDLVAQMLMKDPHYLRLIRPLPPGYRLPSYPSKLRPLSSAMLAKFRGM